jgi:isopropylmalate/homocitrate/citramalate synthase
VGKGKEEWMRAMMCGCDERLEAAHNERLVEEVPTHLKQVHQDFLAASLSREQVHRIIADRAYMLENAVVLWGAACSRAADTVGSRKPKQLEGIRRAGV